MSDPTHVSTIDGLPGDDGPHARARRAQQAAWQAGKSKTVEQLLIEFPELATDRTAMMELIYMEILHRDAKRQSPTLAEYSRRFPALTEQLAVLFPR
jgi:hypothetical protein